MSAPWGVHGLGGPGVRQLEKRYTAAALTAYALVGACTLFWVMLARTMSGGSERAVLVHGRWYLVVAAIPVLIVVVSRALVHRGLLAWVWACAAAMLAVPVVYVGAAAATGQPASEVTDLARMAVLDLLLVPLLVATAVTGRDAMWAPVAALVGVIGIAVVGALEGDVVWGTLAWLPVLVCVLAGGCLQARRHTLGVWGAAFATVVMPVGVAAVAVAVVGPARAADLLMVGAWFLPAAAVLFAAAWRETTNPLVGIFALSSRELRVTDRRWTPWHTGPAEPAVEAPELEPGVAADTPR